MYDDIMRDVSNTLSIKSEKYGRAEVSTEQILHILFPQKIDREYYWMIEPLTRIIEKMCRLVNDPDNIDTTLDLVGYAVILANLHRSKIKD